MVPHLEVLEVQWMALRSTELLVPKIGWQFSNGFLHHRISRRDGSQICFHSEVYSLWIDTWAMSMWDRENRNDSIQLNIQVLATVSAKPSMTMHVSIATESDIWLMKTLEEDPRLFKHSSSSKLLWPYFSHFNTLIIPVLVWDRERRK